MAKIYGQLEKAQLENTTSDTGSLPAGYVTYRTDTNVAKISNGTSMVEQVNLSATQTLTNKTMSGGSNTFTNIPLGSAVTGSLPIANGGTGQTAKTAAFNALSPETTKGDIAVHNGTDVIRVAVGTNGQFLTADSAQASGVKWADYSQTDMMINQTAGDTIGTSNSLIKFTSTENDPDSVYSAATGKFTAPTTKTYTVSWNVVSAAVTLTTSQRLYANIYKNGSFYKYGSRANGTGASNNYQSGGFLASVKLTAGDTLEIRADSSVATTASSAAGDCFFSVRG